MSSSPRKFRTQSGGVTILVALMLLVFITIGAVGMSRNALREIITSGTTRQGAMARSVADSGIEWGILCIDANHNTSSAGSSQSLQTSAHTLAAGLIYGIPYDVTTQIPITSLPNAATPPEDLQVPLGSGNGYNIALTYMGKMPMRYQSATAGTPGVGYTPSAGSLALTAPDLWAIRSDAQVNAGSVAFQHSKEAWISYPPQ